MTVTHAIFKTIGSAYHRVYDLKISIDEMPDAFRQTGFRYAFYQDQVRCYIDERDNTGDDGSHYTAYIEIHQRVNPMYDRAVQSLLGKDLANIIQDSGSDAEIAGRFQLMARQIDRPRASILDELLNDLIDDVMASQILSRIQLSSTYL